MRPTARWRQSSRITGGSEVDRDNQSIAFQRPFIRPGLNSNGHRSSSRCSTCLQDLCMLQLIDSSTSTGTVGES